MRKAKETNGGGGKRESKPLHTRRLRTRCRSSERLTHTWVEDNTHTLHQCFYTDLFLTHFMVWKWFSELTTKFAYKNRLETVGKNSVLTGTKLEIYMKW